MSRRKASAIGCLFVHQYMDVRDTVCGAYNCQSEYFQLVHTFFHRCVRDLAVPPAANADSVQFAELVLREIQRQFTGFP